MRSAISNKDGTFEVHDSILVYKDCVAIKMGRADWRVVEYRTGVLVKGGLKSLNECKQFSLNMPEEYLTQLKKFRASQKYKDLAEKVREVVEKEYGR